MKTKITREQIIDTTLSLIREKNDLKGLNLREIARTLGCAHTNLYNYFPSFNALLWAAMSVLQEKFMAILRDNLLRADTAEQKLKYFFDTFLEVYLGNQGWFRLAWLEYIDGVRPDHNSEVIKKTRGELDAYAADIWKGLRGVSPDRETLSRVMHTAHCYLIGEISNYISGRGLIDTEKDFREHTAKEAMRVFTLCMGEK
jgi:AcrR family transcriptional regulator